MSKLLHLAEHRLLADSLIRYGIRRKLEARAKRCAAEQTPDAEIIQELQDRALAESTDRANEQHYEVPTAYFKYALGKRLKYSSAYWPTGCNSLDEAEEYMLERSCQHAQLWDGQEILELGCGWGSLTLYMAEHYPNSKITAISNSHSQREYIMAEAKLRGFNNVNVQTVDINDFNPSKQFDRVVSVEMFEHVRNHQALFGRLANWLKDDARVFIHVFAHKSQAYLFEPEGDGKERDWMAEYFFTGGIMPSVTLLPHAAEGHLELLKQWEINGTHYSKTLEAWLNKQDANEKAIRNIFKECYGPKGTSLWIQRWRMFYMACSELFAFDKGNEWVVMHYCFGKAE